MNDAFGRPPNRIWSNPDRLVLLAGMAGPVFVTLGVLSALNAVADPALRDALFVRDAFNLWAGGTLARVGRIATVFDPFAYCRATQVMISHRLPLRTWSYPPTMLLLAVPFSLLPMTAMFLVWNSVGTALFWIGARAAGLSRAAACFAVISPAAIESLLAGQNGALCAALILPGLALSARRPWLAGMLLGGLIVKPQMGILVPVVLLASRNWRSTAGAMLSASVLVGMSALVFGWNSWVDFLEKVSPFMQHEILEGAWYSGPHQPMIATAFMAARSAGASVVAAYTLQAIAAMGAAAWCWRAWRDPDADMLSRVALTLALTFFVTPYGYSYDMPALAAALVGLTVRDGPWRGQARLLFAVAWIWPGCGFLVGVLEGPPLGFAAATCAALLAWRACPRGRVAAIPDDVTLSAAAG